MVLLGQPGIAGAMQERSRNEIVNVGVSTTVVSPPRQTAPHRKTILIRNTSDDATKIITVSFGDRPAIANAGIVLRQYESFSDSQSGSLIDGHVPDQSQINAICEVAGGQLSIYER